MFQAVSHLTLTWIPVHCPCLFRKTHIMHAFHCLHTYMCYTKTQASAREHTPTSMLVLDLNWKHFTLFSYSYVKTPAVYNQQKSSEDYIVSITKCLTKESCLI